MRIFKFIYLALGIVLFGAFFSACGKSGEFDAMGVFESDEILVSSEISGKIIDFDIKEGDNLKLGEIVGKIDSVQIELDKERLKEQIATLESSKYDIAKQIAPLEQQSKTAKRELDREERLVKNNAGTQKALDDRIAEFDLLNKQIESQLSSMNLANEALDNEIARTKVEIKILEDNLQKSIITSPIDGVVLEKYAYEGELSSPNRALFKIADIKILRLKAYIIDTDLSRIKLGDEVRIFSDFGSEYREYKGKISWISSKAEFTPKTIMTKDERKNLVYAIKIDVENVDGLLKIGSYGEVKLFN